MKRPLAAALAALMVLTPSFMAGIRAEELEKMGWGKQLQEAGFPLSKEPKEVRIATVQTTYYGDVPELYFTKWYEQQSGVKVKWDLIPEASIKEKVSLMMANVDDLPDAMMGLNFTAADQVNYGSQGIFVPLQDYIAKSKFVKGAYSEKDLKAITAPDGNIYALAGVNECYHCRYPGKAFINQKWLDNLGLKYPETTEDFYNVLKAFKEKDANGNGDPNDEIPMMGFTDGWCSKVYDFLLGSFVYNDFDARLALKDGKITFVANTEDYKEGLKYIRKLVAEGLIDPVSLTQTGDQCKTIAGDPKTVKVGCVTTATWWSAFGEDVADPLKRSQEYVALSPLKGPKGVRNANTVPSGLAAGKFVITDKAKDPELLFRWADGLMSQEATMISSWGEPGKGWLLPTEGAKGINEKPALYQIPPSEGESADKIRTDWMPNVCLANRTSDFRLGQQLPADAEKAKWDSEPRLFRETKKYYEPFHSDESIPSLMFLPEEAEERARLEAQIKNYTDEQLVNFLAGNRDVDADWDAYVAEFDQLELKHYIEILQKAYDRQYGDKK